MGHYVDISNSQYSAKDTALQNRLNGVSGHTILGATLSSNALGIFSFVTSFAEKNNSSGDATGPDVNQNYSAEETKDKQHSFNEARTAFNANQNADTVKALFAAYESSPTNVNLQALKLCAQKSPELFNTPEYKNILNKKQV